MIRGILLILCGTCLTGCVAVNQGSRPMGSITGQLDSPMPPADEDQNVAQQLVAAVPLRR